MICSITAPADRLLKKNAAGFRLLAVGKAVRGQGIGKLLTNECIQKAKDLRLSQVIIHSTKAMQTAWKMYETISFKRSEDLDFMQGELLCLGLGYALISLPDEVTPFVLTCIIITKL